MFATLREDLLRFSDSDKSNFRVFIAGLLSQGFQAILVYRFFRWCYIHHIPAQPFRFFVERFIEITTGISIPAQCQIGKGFRIHHFGGIVLHPETVIGNNCTIYQGVTFGDRGGYGGAPKLGNNVLIGAGAKIIGAIRIADDCIIGANAVVTKDMAPNTIAFGNPAVYKTKDSDTNEQR
ncbi:MAG: serine acetyltransferase [Acidobacteria bacterium]|nr:serine acetyltransferase [Acidobacteriota bacterium]